MRNEKLKLSEANIFEIDKQQFGTFIAELRKEKGYTQKDLAQKLFVSDKAVSKWERGLSMPDISLLVPLADILGVTVTELLKHQRMEQTDKLDTEQVEEIVKKALILSEDTPEKKKELLKKHIAILGGCALLAILELILGILYLSELGVNRLSANLLFLEAMSVGFGIYFWLFMQERLPVYYDENKISVYSASGFSFSVPGVNFNNSNWRHIVKALRIWTIITMLTIPILSVIQSALPLDYLQSLGFPFTVLILYLLGLFVPVYVIGKKYE